MLNGATKKAIYATLGALFVLGVGAVGTWGISRASDEDVEKLDGRQTQHEREAGEKFTQILVNQGILATSIDFLVQQQDPTRAPIAPKIVAPVDSAEASP